MKRRIRYVQLELVAPAEANVKRHDAGLIAGSIERFGFLAPLVVDERTGRLVAGHGRLEELRRRHREGEPAPDGIREKGEAWFVPVVSGWSSSDDREADAAAVSLNRIEEQGGWNMSELYAMLDDFAGQGRLEGTGFTMSDLDTMLEDLSRQPDRFGGAGSAARTDVAIGAKAETYRTNGIRGLVLDYPAAACAALQEAMGRLRKARGAETNAVLVKMLLEEAE